MLYLKYMVTKTFAFVPPFKFKAALLTLALELRKEASDGDFSGIISLFCD